jgi:dTDP-4-dehydrorhamnose reductase
MAFNEFSRIVILGGNGMMGRYAAKYFSKYRNVFVTTRQSYDFNVPTTQVVQLLGELIKPNDVVINCIGMTNKRETASPEDELAFYRINVALPRLAALRCVMIGAWFVHITTDCVYTGDKTVHGTGPAWFPKVTLDGNRCDVQDSRDTTYYCNEQYIERKSLKDSTDLYGFTKALGDQALQDMKNTTVFRVSIIGEEESNGKSFVEWVLRSAVHSTTISGYTNHRWNGVTCLELCEEIELLVTPTNLTVNDRNREVKFSNVITLSSSFIPVGSSASGTSVNNDGSGERPYITKAELVQCIIDVYKLNLTVVPCEAQTTVNRDLHCCPYTTGDIRAQIQKMYEFDVCGRRFFERVVPLKFAN